MRKRLNKVWSKRHLPEELWPQILSRLPVKSLLRFRCVSKPWLSLIDDREFGRLHLKNFKNNCDETHLFVVQGRKNECVVRCSNTFKTTSETIHTLGRKTNAKWKVVCSIDGLVLLKSRNRGLSGFTDLMVWNPSIRKFHELPSLPEIKIPSDTDNYSIWDTEIGLGFDPLIKDYKHVKLIFEMYGFRNPNLHAVAVYTLGANSWKIIPFKGKGCSKWEWHEQPYGIKAVYLQGSLYFIGHDDEDYVLDLVSFDLSSEVFSTITPPAEIRDMMSNYKEYQLALVDGGCSLAVSDFGSFISVLESFVGEGESMCWTKRYTFDWDSINVLYIKKNNDILMQWPGQEVTFYLANGKEVKQRHDVIFTYNLETEKQKILMQKKRGAMSIHYVLPYVESLILLK